MLTADDLQVLFTELFPESLIDELAIEFGVVERQRKIDIRAFIPALVLGAGTPDGGLQADALHAYLDMNVPSISRAAFYKRFDERLEKMMAALARTGAEGPLPLTGCGAPGRHRPESAQHVLLTRNPLLSDHALSSPP